MLSKYEDLVLYKSPDKIGALFDKNINQLIQVYAMNGLKVSRDEVVISTKVLGKMKEKPNNSGLSRYNIFNSVDNSLKRLKLEYIDILYVHGVDFKTKLEDIVRSLNDVVESGKVRYIAICNWPA